MLLQKKDSEGFGFVLRGAKGAPSEINILRASPLLLLSVPAAM